MRKRYILKSRNEPLQIVQMTGKSAWEQGYSKTVKKWPWMLLNQTNPKEVELFFFMHFLVFL